jgi:YVTN family beta-propeller protein
LARCHSSCNRRARWRGSGIAPLDRIDRILGPAAWVAAALVVVLLFAGPSLVGADKETPAAAAKGGDAAPTGASVFASAGCGGCHTLKAAGASGSVGPNLDDAGLDAAAVRDVVTSGRGSMPKFGGQLSAPEITAVASYVASGGKEAAATATPAAATTGASPKAAATIPAGKGPDGITVGDDGTVYIANASAGTLTRIAPGGSAVKGATRVGRQPDSPVAVGDAVWLVASGDEKAVRVQGARTTEVPTGSEPSALAVGAKSVWVANAGDGTVTRIEASSGRVIGDPIRVGGRPTDLAVADGVVWVTNFDDATVTRIDAASQTVTGDPIQVGRRPRSLAIGDGSVWVTNAGDGTVTRIDATTGTVTGAPIPVGTDPREVAFGAGAVWVTNAADDTVTRIDPKTAAATGDPIRVGKDPIGIAAGADAVYTADFRGDTITKITP